jgi:hypothetical protein
VAEIASHSSSNVQKWALLIGINEYPKLESRYHLEGCLNDVDSLEELLTSRLFAFPARNILKLSSPAADAEHLATRDNILAAFRRHLIENDKIQQDDIVVIYYSGHGSQIPDEDGDEEDGFDETIVPCDSGDRSNREEVRDISDDEISALLDQLALRTKNINLLIDSCHSGTITRALMDAESTDALGRERYLPPASYPVTTTTRPVTRAATRAMGPSGWMPLSDGYVVVSACMANERAREDRFSFWRRKPYGIMTHYLLEAMKEIGPETTYFDIWDQLRIKVSKHNRWQTPQIEGALERKVFGGAALPRKRYVEVLAKSAEGVELAAGLVHGATSGSKFAIFNSGTQTFDDPNSRVAVLRLMQVDAFNSIGEIEKGSADHVQVGAPAIEIEHNYGDMQMRVEVIGSGDQFDEMRRQITASNLLALAQPNGAPSIARVRLRYPFNTEGQEVTSEGEKLFILSAGDGHPLVEPILPDQNSPRVVKEKLEKIASFYNVLAITNPDPQSKIKDKIKLRLLKVIGKDQNNSDLVAPVERNSGGEMVLTVGERVIVEVDNQSDQPLHLVILMCDSAWGITPIFPKANAEDTAVAAKSTRRTIRFKVNLYDYQKPVKPNQPLPREVLKVIATTERIEFRSFWQESTRDLEISSLETLMEKAMGVRLGQGTRSLEPDPAVKDWTTAELLFDITT